MLRQNFQVSGKWCQYLGLKDVSLVEINMKAIAFRRVNYCCNLQVSFIQLSSYTTDMLYILV